MRVVPAPQRSGVPVLDLSRRGGEVGARRVCEVLGARLDDRHIFIRDLILPGGEEAVDGVLLGPRVLVMAFFMPIEDESLRVRGSTWERQVGEDRWVRLADDPSKRAAHGARRVAYALRSARLPAYHVDPVVVVIEGRPCRVEDAHIPVVGLPGLVLLVREGVSPVNRDWPSIATRALAVAASYGARDARVADSPVRNLPSGDSGVGS